MLKFNVSIGLTLLSMLTFFATIAPTASAQKTQLLGQTRLSLREKDLDVLNFARCQQPPIAAIKLRAFRGAAEVNTLVVRYGNNVSDRLPVRSTLRQGGETNWIDLKGDRRCIKGIAILGSTERSRDQTIIQFYGR
jgi:Protein of unknown function (DUF2541)